jgi:uncharacterized protein
MTEDEKIDAFLKAKAFGVVGASEDPEKYGHKCFASLIGRGYNAYPINPRAKTVLDRPAYATIAALPEKADALSVITPPAVTEKVVDDAIAAGVKHIWMQPGAESAAAVAKAEAAGLSVISGGACLLVVLATAR